MVPIIKIRELSKRYKIGERVPYRTLRDSLMTAARAPLRLGCSLVSRSNGLGKTTDANEVWALRDVTFDVMPGEVLGVIGRNGAGKSTLLKVLSRITEPTAGRVELYGRLGSLLEVGTGFHPELTGRENIFLSAAIMGMTRKDIIFKFDDIVSFAEIEKFVDTPVKHYSSGMYVRLAFAVAAHLEPEILLVDEVLAVGDAEFQRKCLERMGLITKEGRTVLLVSHNMASIHRLCRRAVLLDQGKVETVGPVADVIHRYQQSTGDATKVTARGISISGVRIVPLGSSAFGRDAGLRCEAELSSDRPISHCYLNLHVDDGDGRSMIHSRTDFIGLAPKFEPGVHRLGVELSRLNLRAGAYTVWLRLFLVEGLNDRIVDSERVLLEVPGFGLGFGLVDVPVKWSWSMLSELE